MRNKAILLILQSNEVKIREISISPIESNLYLETFNKSLFLLEYKRQNNYYFLNKFDTKKGEEQM